MQLQKSIALFVIVTSACSVCGCSSTGPVEQASVSDSAVPGSAVQGSADSASSETSSSSSSSSSSLPSSSSATVLSASTSHETPRIAKVASPSGAMPLYVAIYLNPRDLLKYVGQYRREPNNQVAFFHSAQYSLGYRQYTAAEKLANDALKAHPDWASPYFILAKVSESQLDDLQSLKYLQMALEASPHWLDAASAYADKLNACEKFADCVAVCTKTLGYCRGLPSDLGVTLMMRKLRFIKAQALYNLKDFGAAAKEMEMDLAQEDNQIKLRLLADCYAKNKQWAKALAIVDRLCRETPTDYNFHFLRAEIYVATNQTQKAIAELTTCLKLKRFQVKNIGLGAMKVLEERDALLLRAEMYEKVGNQKLAAKDRAVLKQASVSSFQEAAFRSNP